METSSGGRRDLAVISCTRPRGKGDESSEPRHWTGMSKHSGKRAEEGDGVKSSPKVWRDKLQGLERRPSTEHCCMSGRGKGQSGSLLRCLGTGSSC